ncbi:nitroreductase family protein [Candidatus Woesearchaeota archaeon]|nr:nitroreductase family protein [Candidatus Woesearchaeota archaeon]
MAEGLVRHPDHPINTLILNRWSPRSMTGEELEDKELMSLFEAARWAPSSYNNQPWRFLYAKRNTKQWSIFLDLLVEGNRVWAQNAAVLVVVASKKTFDHNNGQSKTHSFDAGAAWENLALEGTSRGLVVHGMEGFDSKKARMSLKIPENYDVEAMIAIGIKGPKESLPESYQKAERPNQRKPLKDIVMEGVFVGK